MKSTLLIDSETVTRGGYQIKIAVRVCRKAGIKQSYKQSSIEKEITR